MKESIISRGNISFHLPVKSPYIFNAHHYDFYPKGNDRMEPIEYLNKRNVGDDFDMDSPWRMYHGNMIPGFPVHPHRGFETVTIVEQGFVDHSDSLGSTGRYGEGDVQWLTAGSGIQHCEMFPLVHEDKENTLELFQVWLNLPAKNKMKPAEYKMLWKEDIPIVKQEDAQGKTTSIKVIAGEFEGVKPPAPPQNSWAFEEENNVQIWLLTMEPGAKFLIPPTAATTGRMLYFYLGDYISIDNEKFEEGTYAELTPENSITIQNGKKLSKLLLLSGEQIHEPVAARGPFVMNDETEILLAMRDYQRTEFGGWPWDRRDHVNPPNAGRFAKHSDGTVEYPKNK